MSKITDNYFNNADSNTDNHGQSKPQKSLLLLSRWGWKQCRSRVASLKRLLSNRASNQRFSQSILIHMTVVVLLHCMQHSQFSFQQKACASHISEQNSIISNQYLMIYLLVQNYLNEFWNFNEAFRLQSANHCRLLSINIFEIMTTTHDKYYYTFKCSYE